jgi:hypothetical protein
VSPVGDFHVALRSYEKGWHAVSGWVAAAAGGRAPPSAGEDYCEAALSAEFSERLAALAAGGVALFVCARRRAAACDARRALRAMTR